MPRFFLGRSLVLLAIGGWLYLPAHAQAPSVVRADSLYTAGARELARRELDELILHAEASADSALLRDALLARGRQAAGVGRAREAAPDLARADALARRTGADALARNALRWLGYTQLTLGALDSARTIYDRLLIQSTGTADPYHEAHAHFGLAYLELQAGRRGVARQRYGRAIELFRELGQARDELYVLVGLARVLTADGDVAAARKVYASILERSRELGLRQPAAQALNNLAVLEFELGSADRAVQNFRAAGELYSEAGEVAETLGVATNLSACLIQLGRLAQAEALLDSTLRRADAGGFRDRIVRLLISRADVARARHDPALAESCLVRALDLSDPRDVSRRLDVLRARAPLRAYSNPALAAGELERDSRALRDLASGADLADLDLTLARLLLAAGSVAKASDAARNAATFARTGTQRLTLLQALTVLARAERELGHREEASARLEEALATWESIRGTPRDPEWRERWGALSRALSSEFVALLSREEAPPSDAEIRSTFAILQRFKARTFIERLTGFGGLAGGDSLRAQTLAGMPELSQLQSVLAPDEMLLDLHGGPDATIVFVLTREHFELRQLSGGAELASRVPLLWEIVSRPPSSAAAGAAVDEALTAWLHDFVAPLDDLTARYPKILVAADGIWHSAPLEAIDGLLPELETEISRIPSPQVLFELRTRRAARSSEHGEAVIEGLLIASSFGGDRALRGSLREAQELTARWSNLTARIDEPIELDELSRMQWLHFAMHAKADLQRPWNSSLQLHRRDGDAQELTAYEILSLPLDLRLCVLSACQSAAAQILPGEGMLGLASAFLIAGSDAVVAALWKVDDATTARFMWKFYEALGENRSAAAALRAARGAIRADAKTRHPYYWAGFCLSGEPSTTLPLQPESNGKTPLFLVAFGILGAGVVIFLRRRTP